jgi:hypothetical protein
MQPTMPVLFGGRILYNRVNREINRVPRYLCDAHRIQTRATGSEFNRLLIEHGKYLGKQRCMFAAAQYNVIVF